MAADAERRSRIQSALKRSAVDALVCCGPTEVLLLTGYWPILGGSVAVVGSSGDEYLIVPHDEEALARATSEANIVAYRPFSLDRLTTPIEALAGPLSAVLQSKKLSGKTLGVEFRQRMQPTTYAASLEYYGSLIDLLESLHLSVHFISCDPVLEPLRAVKTVKELGMVRESARIAAAGFSHVHDWIRPGVRESEIAAECRRAYERFDGHDGIERSYGFFYCMSGANSAEASAPFARTRQRRLEEGDLVLIHANTCADGYWTDITRTYTVGDVSDRQRSMRRAIEEARAEALGAVRPGARGSDVDRAARNVMERHGLGGAFRHATGHGVGFAAANANGIPRIHPRSPDVLEEGMTFNIEPAAYFDGYGGMRHCDMVAVTKDGFEVLTDF
jgi:Xaa-Pro aminopeptidase